MTPQINREYSKILEKIAENLDITPTQYQLAVERYEAVGNWLDADNSPLKPYNPKITPQGSFRLGTVIKPLTDDEEYDVDLTCKLHILKVSITQQRLKRIVGDRLKENDNYRRMLTPEKQRCWRLQYAESFRFHLDIVPSIPDTENEVLILESRNVPRNIAQHALCITDNETWDYAKDFPKSNPEGYALWFQERMKVEFQRRKQLLSEYLSESVENIPDYKVKTPLQRVVQLLKRHRDSKYSDDADKPISIIITTLSAKAYNNELDIFEALRNVLDKMESHIEKDFFGNYLIKNPVNPLENFADKWVKKPRKKILFFEWLADARRDFAIIANMRGVPEIATSLKSYFGEKVVNQAYNEYGSDVLKAREGGNLFMEKKTGILSTSIIASSIPVAQHTNFGNE